MEPKIHRTRTDELIREIASKTKQVIGEDDPILLVAAFNDRLIANYQDAIATTIEQASASSKIERDEWSASSKEMASKVLTAALQQAAEKIEAKGESIKEELSKNRLENSRLPPAALGWQTWIAVSVIAVLASVASTLTYDLILNGRPPKSPTVHPPTHSETTFLDPNGGRPL